MSRRSRWRVCTHPDCGQLVNGGGRCHEHQPKDTRPSAAARGYDARWRATRSRFLREHPACAVCGSTSSPEVHHPEGLGPSGPRGHDPQNLQPLGAGHHKEVTAREQPGGWARDQRGGPYA